ARVDAAAARAHGPARPGHGGALRRRGGGGALVRAGARAFRAGAGARRAQRTGSAAGAGRMGATTIRNMLGQGLAPGDAQGAGRAPRIVFAMLSATTPPATVTQLAQLLAPHRIVIHHSPHLQPDFRVDAANVDFVPNPDTVRRGD